jgi:hypothetical protein
MRDHVASVLGIGGCVAMTIGAGTVAAALGWFVGGLCAVWLAWRLS